MSFSSVLSRQCARHFVNENPIEASTTLVASRRSPRRNVTWAFKSVSAPRVDSSSALRFGERPHNFFNPRRYRSRRNANRRVDEIWPYCYEPGPQSASSYSYPPHLDDQGLLQYKRGFRPKREKAETSKKTRPIRTNAYMTTPSGVESRMWPVYLFATMKKLALWSHRYRHRRQPRAHIVSRRQKKLTLAFRRRAGIGTQEVIAR